MTLFVLSPPALVFRALRCRVMARIAAFGLLVVLAACAAPPAREQAPPNRAQINALIHKYAGVYGIPESLIHRTVARESGYNPKARHGIYMGLMQIDPRTARAMGHTGPAEALLDAETNLIYGVKYLRGAWLVAKGNEKAADRWYQRGYYYQAKKMGLLEEVGLRR